LIASIIAALTPGARIAGPTSPASAPVSTLDTSAQIPNCPSRPTPQLGMAVSLVLVSALHERTPVGTVHVVTVSHKISHCFIEFYNATMIAVHDNSHTLSHAPHRQIGIKGNVPIAGRSHEEHKAVIIVILDGLQVSQNSRPINLFAPH
jgi:hypothetical protein